MKWYQVLYVYSTLIALLVAMSVCFAAEDENTSPIIPASPVIAQQQLSELIKKLDQISTEISTRESVVMRLKAIKDEAKQPSQPGTLQKDIKELTKVIEEQQKSNNGYIITKTVSHRVQNMISRFYDDLWDNFPSIMELWNASKNDPRTATASDQYLAECGNVVQNAIWKTPPMRNLDDFRRLLYLDQNDQSVTIPDSSISEWRNLFDQQIEEQFGKKIQDSIASEISRHEAALIELRKTRSSQQEQQKQLNNAIEEGQSQIDKKIIQWGLPSLGLLLLGILAVPMLYKEKDLQATIFSSGIVLDMFTVFLLTVTILLLGLGHRLSENVLGTLLGGISGYVLGRSNKRISSGNQAK